MIHIFRTNPDGIKPYYEGDNDSVVWIMVAQIIHIRECGDGVTEIVVRSHQYTTNYYTTTPFKQIQGDVNHVLKRGSSK